MSGMLMLLRHLLAILVLPVSVAIFIPMWIARRYSVHLVAPAGFAESLLLVPGFVLLLAGLLLFAACLFGFATQGRGTLAPWDPPRELVVRGPYRFVRNPMISGVILVLFAEAFLLRSIPHAVWAGGFLGLNLIYLPLLEEPDLATRFGDDYRRYKQHVPRFLPRLRPWSGS